MRLLAPVLTVALLATSSVALAQPQGDSARSDYTFEDDALLGDTLGTLPPLIQGSKRRPRILLIRPRTSFLAEMYKSVQAL